MHVLATNITYAGPASSTTVSISYTAFVAENGTTFNDASIVVPDNASGKDIQAAIKSNLINVHGFASGNIIIQGLISV